ncbi:FAR-17a/AIG1-like protein-domain-containing protein [Bipolaris maydis]|nr:FAR-17a/AIG1-like protein-domain-containing protein [Bipolaris maydis]
MASKTSAEIKPTSSRRHPLQRFDSPSKGFSGALHNKKKETNTSKFNRYPNVFSSSFDLTFTSLDQSPDMPSDPPAAALSSHLFRLKNYLALVAAPMEITISVLYWTIKAIDGKLLVSPCHREIPLPPVFYDIGFHLVPAVVLTTDSLLLSPPWPTTPMNESAPMITLSLSTIVAFSYWIWIEICYSQNGFYPYPIFQILTTSQRVGLFVVSGVIMWVVGGGLRIAYAKVNGYESVEHLDKVRRSKVMGGSGKVGVKVKEA